MTLDLAGRLAALKALSGQAALLSGDLEIQDAGRKPLGLSESVELQFGPARRDWLVTGIAVYHGSRRLLVEPLKQPVDVYVGQMFRLSVSAVVDG